MAAPRRVSTLNTIIRRIISEDNARRQTEMQQLEQSAPTTHPTDITLKNAESIPDEKSPYKYMESYNSFESQTCRLGIWVLTFMAKEEIYNIAPAMEMMSDRDSDTLLTFTQYLNPNYICFRADHILRLDGTDIGLAIPDMRSAKDTVRAWNDAREFSLQNSIVRALAAVSCFIHFREFEEAVIRSLRLEDPHGMTEYFEQSACALFAELDNGNHYDINSAHEKWRKIKTLGANLTMLAEIFGGEGFLILFPLSELEVLLGKQLLEVHSIFTLCGVLCGLLQSTEMGKFFESMASAVGKPLIHKCCRGQSLTQSEFLQQLNSIRTQYSLPQVSELTPRLATSVLAKQPKSAPFGYCGSLEVKHVNPSLSLMPLSLLQFVGNHLEPEVVEYLIRQQLPREWAVIGREDISHPASRELLLCDHQGIMIPLCIDGAWTLFCYTNPARIDIDYLIKFVNPTKSCRRYDEALNMLSAWIPKRGPWIPNGLKLRSVKVVDSQGTDEKDSGIHIILDAIAMARTGKPEARPLNAQVCKGLRIKYFVHLLNELQEAVNKEAMNKISKTMENPR
ncbi:hypothetical protein F5Y12DRAFT_795742 [Xylaria sp. FL1777]|nr:hypothetical protein F5Y12DRAFT_795742 [Xylaria sp. FL1777]